MIGRTQVRQTRRIVFNSGFLFAVLVLGVSSAFAQVDDFGVHIQPKPGLLAQSQSAQPDAGQSSPQPGSQPSPDQQQQLSPPPHVLVVPAGTRLPLVLARPLSIKHTHEGDTAYLQTTFPIGAGNQMAIPPGTFLQGTIDRVTRRDTLQRVLAFDLRAVQVIFSTGYTIAIPGTLGTDPVLAQNRAPAIDSGDSVPVLASTGGPTPPPLPPLPPPPGFGAVKVLVIVGAAASVGLAITGAVLSKRGDILMEPGISMQAVLTEPLELDGDRVMVAVQQYATQSATAPPPVSRPRTMGTCWTAGSPGTPDTVIPGTPAHTIPGTPDITIPGNPPTVIPGTPPTVIPGTPDTVLPGTPATDPQPYPCPR